jgi:CRP-like cAMP-binding protein/Fe-S-cluster-containing hydrogenase component 2
MTQPQAADQSRELVSFLGKHVKIFQKSKETAVEGLVKESKLLRFRKEQAVIKQGEYGESFYIVVSGQVGISVTSEDGKVIPIRDMGPGDFFGELAVMGQGLRTATVSAKGDDTVLLEVHKIPFQKVLKADHALKDEMDKIFNNRVIASFVRRVRYFQGVDDKLMQKMIDNASIKTFKKNETLYQEGELCDNFYLLKVGNVKLTRKRADGSQGVIAYFNEGDFFGDVGSPNRRGSAWAIGRVEAVALKMMDIYAILQKHPDLEKHVARSDTDSGQGSKDQPPAPGVGGDPNALNKMKQARTVMMAVDQMMSEGIVQAESALIIYMDRCIRCGNCSRSCQARHNVSRMVRRGPTVKRRKGKNIEEMNKNVGKHELVLFPTSCRHCIDPECMIGCPTGAISRDRLGEVFIKDFCIACGNCARRCPYGNISLADNVAVVGQPGKTKRMAVKCDQCRDYAEAACVYNCPRGAIFRINPNEYFPEAKQVKEAF